MRIFLCFVFVLWPGIFLFAQIEPVQNSDSELKALKVKAISSYFYSTKDTAGVDAKLVLKKEFDANGKITKKYILSLWEAVSYSKSSTFKYNREEQLVEKSMIQEILNLGENDKEFINSFGDTPLNEKIRYAYNQDGQLVIKEIFEFSTAELSNSTPPSQKIIYAYDSGLLMSEKSSSANTEIFNQHFQIEYKYDDLGNLMKTSRTYGSEMNLRSGTDYIYDIENRLVEEKIIDVGIPRNSGHFKYEYDEANRLKNKLVFDEEESDFVLEVSYTYDQYGNKISGEKEIEFTYFKNGLIQSELWQDNITDQIFYFVSKYEFY